MIYNIQGFSEYKDIVQVYHYHYHPFQDQIFENCIHHHLEGSRTVGQAKEHY